MSYDPVKIDQEFVNKYNSLTNITVFSIINLFDAIPNLPKLEKKFMHVKCLDKEDGKIVFNSTGISASDNHEIFRYYNNIDKATFI